MGYIRERVAAHCKEVPEKVLLYVRRRDEEEGGRAGGEGGSRPWESTIG